MADLIPNIAKGRFVEFYDRVDNNDPTNAVLVLVIIAVTGSQDGVILDADTLSALLGDSNIAEVTNTNYARVTLDDSDLTAFAPDDVNDRAEIDIADQTYTAIAAGDDWDDLVVCYDSDSTGGTDANIIPMVSLDLDASPDGNDITITFDANGIARAS